MRTLNRVRTLQRVAGAVAIVLLMTATVLAAAGSFTITTMVPAQPLPPKETALVQECLGESVVLDGLFHLQFHTTVNDLGNFYSEYAITPAGVVATGVESGATYSVTGIERGTFSGVFNFDDPNWAPPSTNKTGVVILARRDDGPSFQLRYTIHLVFNAEDEVTAEISHETVSCK